MPIITPEGATFHGLVISERERNMHDDSDFYATVWNVETGAADEILWGTTRGAMSPGYGYNCIVDAEQWVLAAYAAWRAKENVAHARRVIVAMAEFEWLRYVGDVVTVVAGRKCPKGYTGEVVRVYEENNPFASGWTKRYGHPVNHMLMVTDGKSTRTVKSDYTKVLTRSPSRLQELFDAGC